MDQIETFKNLQIYVYFSTKVSFLCAFLSNSLFATWSKIHFRWSVINTEFFAGEVSTGLKNTPKTNEPTKKTPILKAFITKEMESDPWQVIVNDWKSITFVHEVFGAPEDTNQ